MILAKASNEVNSTVTTPCVIQLTSQDTGNSFGEGYVVAGQAPYIAYICLIINMYQVVGVIVLIVWSFLFCVCLCV